MKGPRRLVESSENDLERLLLRAGREQAPRGAKRRAILAATGAAAVVTTLGAGSAAGAAAAGKASATATTLLSLKWLVVVGVASVGVAAGTAAVHVVRAERAEAATAQVAAKAEAHASSKGASLRSRAIAAVVSAPVPSTPEAPASPPLDPLVAAAGADSSRAVPAPANAPTAVVRPAATANVPAKAVAAQEPSRASVAPEPPHAPKDSAAAASDPVAELAMLDQARAAIRGGQPAGGLAVLDDYARRFPRGAMAPEASILRIEALVGAGDRDAAKRAGEAFLRANPSSPYASRIDSLVSSPHP